MLAPSYTGFQVITLSNLKSVYMQIKPLKYRQKRTRNKKGNYASFKDMLLQ